MYDPFRKSKYPLSPLREDATTFNKYDETWFDRTGRVLRITTPSPQEVILMDLCTPPKGARGVCLTHRPPEVPGRPRDMEAVPFHMPISDTDFLNKTCDANLARIAVEAKHWFRKLYLEHQRDIKTTAAKFLEPDGRSTYRPRSNGGVL